MDNDTLIISLTSYPQRIKYVKEVLESMVNQTADRELYHIVLVLANPQFPNKEKDLPSSLLDFIKKENIEIIWYDRDIRSHKKYIPTVKKYPENPILIADDDVIRKDWWVQMFINDSKKYPNDILAGIFVWEPDENFRFHMINKSQYKIPYGEITSERYANGLGGTLFPPHTFNDERFFDEDLFMELCPYSDESWDYCFNVIEDRTIRQTSIIYDYRKNNIKKSQQLPTTLGKINNYKQIFSGLAEYFPEFKEKFLERIKKNNEVKVKNSEVIKAKIKEAQENSKPNNVEINKQQRQVKIVRKIPTNKTKISNLRKKIHNLRNGLNGV